MGFTPAQPEQDQGLLSVYDLTALAVAILLSTGNQLIVENSPTDYYWGCGADGSGKNKLGQILMQVRDLLR